MSEKIILVHEEKIYYVVREGYAAEQRHAEAAAALVAQVKADARSIFWLTDDVLEADVVNIPPDADVYVISSEVHPKKASLCVEPDDEVSVMGGFQKDCVNAAAKACFRAGAIVSVSLPGTV